jgi:mannosyltransferase
MRLPDILVTNLHRRYTGVSATVFALLPHQQMLEPIGLWDTGELQFSEEQALQVEAVGLFHLLVQGWSKPRRGRFRVWHARRDIEILAGLFFRSVLRQPWRVVFTSAAPKPPGWALRFLIRHCDAVIATSQRSADFLKGVMRTDGLLIAKPHAPHGQESTINRIIHHGVDTRFFHPISSAEKKLRRTQVELPGDHLLGAFGRLRPSKGTDLFVDALIELLPRHPSWSAILTGLAQPNEMRFVKELQQRIQKAGLEDRIHFLGDLPVQTIRDWFQTVDICVAASRREGFGLTPLEAMACGAAVVTSDAGVWPWIVDEEVGRIFPASASAVPNPKSLIDALEPLLADPGHTARLGQAARSRAEQRHAIQQEATAIHDVYESLRD